MEEEFIEFLIEFFKNELVSEFDEGLKEGGLVISIGDGIASIGGLDAVKAGDIVEHGTDAKEEIMRLFFEDLLNKKLLEIYEMKMKIDSESSLHYKKMVEYKKIFYFKQELQNLINEEHIKCTSEQNGKSFKYFVNSKFSFGDLRILFKQMKYIFFSKCVEDESLLNSKDYLRIIELVRLEKEIKDLLFNEGDKNLLRVKYIEYGANLYKLQNGFNAKDIKILSDMMEGIKLSENDKIEIKHLREIIGEKELNQMEKLEREYSIKCDEYKVLKKVRDSFFNLIKFEVVKDKLLEKLDWFFEKVIIKGEREVKSTSIEKIKKLVEYKELIKLLESEVESEVKSEVESEVKSEVESEVKALSVALLELKNIK